MAKPESDDFHLGKMVGETMGRIAEQERIIELIQDMELTITDLDDEPVDIIKVDWTNFFNTIRGHDEGETEC